MILKDPNFVESREHSTHNRATQCMLKFKNHFDLLVDKKNLTKKPVISCV